MKKNILFFCAIALLSLSSFRTNVECEYVNSNMGYAKSQINAALGTQDINQARFYAYKALSALEKSKKQLNVCGCKYAKESMLENMEVLSLATKSTTLEGTINYLHASIELTNKTILVLESHDTHESAYGNDELSINTNSSVNKTPVTKSINKKDLFKTIDTSLEKYRISLDKVVESVNCKDATAFASKIFNECEAQLLNPNISEGSKYYNLRTKEITAEALTKIGDCAAAK
ncbi:hypothetical protein QSV08_10890 [Maribacter sp. BPC-D8]|uniref:hypothetical protein n=1 Tax=Maribacter sp. BPC-D8 TaxID=3053613 RepID=UPI002B485242|nr:hypothetical protein [Maribacter sp. BPC-D8]WRI27732.1 hypothetical protein QSV08_10890 [Maribacter sp. BPC-D8]